MVSHKLYSKSLSCPQCNKKLDGATGLTGDQIPQQGSICICFYCATPLIYQGYNNNLHLRAMTENELFDIKMKSFSAWCMIQETIKQLRSKK